MQQRTPAVAGTFYPGEAESLRSAIAGCVSHDLGPGTDAGDAVGVICPHAGYAYSGPIACHSFAAMSSRRPELFIMIGPNHYGIGSDVATVSDYTWQTPLGSVEVDSVSAEEMADESDVVELDHTAHSKEHSLEVQVPMLQWFFPYGFKILPISLAIQDRDTAVEVGHAVSRIARGRDAAVIGSSDLTHYEPNEVAHMQDGALIDAILGMDADEFYAVLNERRVSACGYGAIASAMTACADMGASGGTLLKYATSGDVTGDETSVVGYGSIAFN